MAFKSYKDIPVWHAAHCYVLDVYHITKKFPKSELFAITSQLQRASSSVPANIAEGFSRKGTKELIQFLYQAKASLVESEYFLFLSKDLHYIAQDEYDQLYAKFDTIHYQLNSWIKALRKK